MKQLPNWLTLSRLLMAPLLVLVFYTAAAEWRDPAVTAIFLIAMITDFLDGYLARSKNSISALGEFLDPVADKILIITALLLLLAVGRAPLAAVLIIVMREVAVMALREWTALRGRQVKVSGYGKWKTVVQAVALSFLLYHADLFGLPVAVIGEWLLWLAALLSVVSLALYWRAVRIGGEEN